MTKADSAQVNWDAQKKRWVVRIKIGEEVVKRPGGKASQAAEERTLRDMAVQIAKDDGYELDAASVAIAR
jgi:hypothetical protein